LLQDLPRGGGSDLDPEDKEFAVDAPVAPARILACQAQHQLGTRVDGSAGVQVGSGNVQVNNYYDSETAATAQAAFSALFTQRIIPLHDGLHTGTMLAIEIRAQHELEQAKADGVPDRATGPDDVRYTSVDTATYRRTVTNADTRRDR
jgi:hypothetical protein